MESKHFSHHHPLVLTQVRQSSQIHCSGCKYPASGNVYVCHSQCSYFLHEQCFCARRSLNHPSHPLHPLTLVPLPTNPSSSFLCNSCNLAGHGFSYTCSHCDFDIHLHCALNPNPTPHASPSPLTAQNFNNPIPIYPPPFPTYPPQNNSAIPNTNTQNKTDQSHITTNPIYPPPFPTYPHQNSTIPNQTQNCTQSQTSTNNSPPNTKLPNQTHACTPIQSNPPLGYPHTIATPQISTPATVPPPPPLPQVSTIKHFSHPHGLKQLDLNDETTKLCSACELKLSGSVYCCTEPQCIFSLHKACFDSPREIRHGSHPRHNLTLLTAPRYSTGSFTCDACRKRGTAFAYACGTCSYDLHIDCIRWPETLTRPDHKHPLALHYESPAVAVGGGAVFICSACGVAADEKAWVYYCRECDFGTHLECVNSEIKPQSQSGGGGGEAATVEEELLRFQMQKMNLDFQLQMAKQHAEFMASIANSWNYL